MDFLCNLVSTSKQLVRSLLCIESLDHMEMEHMDRFEVQVLQGLFCTGKMDLQSSRLGIDKEECAC